MPIRVLIADDQRLFRQSLRYLLEQEEEITVIGEAADGQDAFTMAQEVRPDIILMDVDMPKLDGIKAARMILDSEPAIKILMLSVYDDDERVITAICNGAIGYILKDADHREFIRIIRGTARGEKVISPFLANRIPRPLPQKEEPVVHHDKKGEPHSGTALLTEKEREALTLLAKGKSNKEIADTMAVSVETIKSHLQMIYKKLGVKSRTEAAISFLKRGEEWPS